MKIRTKLTLSFLAIAVLVAIVGFYSVLSSQKMLENTIQKHFSVSVAGVLDDIDRRIHARIETFREESANPKVLLAVLASNRDFDLMNNAQEWIAEQDRIWISAGAEEITPFMQDIISNELSKYFQGNLEYYRNTYGYDVFGEFFITNRYGVNIAQTGKTSDYDQADESWWQQARDQGFSVSTAHYDESSGVYCIDIGLRIDDENGVFAGGMKVVLNLQEFETFIESARAAEEYKSIQYELLDETCGLIYSTQDYHFVETVPADIPTTHAKDCLYTTEGSLVHKVIKGMDRTILVCHAHSRGFRDFKGLGWTLYAQIDTLEVYAECIRFEKKILVISGVIALLGVAAGMLLSRTIARPIVQLTAALSGINRNNLNRIPDRAATDEVRQLTLTFNRMIEDLKATTSSIDDLNREVSERRAVEMHVGRQNRFLNSILESMTHPFYVIDAADYSIKLANSAAKALNPGVETFTCHKLTHHRDTPCDGADHVCPLQIVKDTRKPVVLEHIHQDSQGQVVFVEVHAFPVFDDHGNVARVIEYSMDITERKKTEEALKQACLDMEKVNQNLLSMKAQSIQNEKMASIGQLAAGVAHEINNPVGFVSSNFETLENYGDIFLRLIATYEELAEEIRKCEQADLAEKGEKLAQLRKDLKMDFIIDDIHALFEDSREGLDRITKIIQSLRDFSRIDQVTDYTEYDFNEGIQSTLVVARNEIKYDCEIETRLGDIPPVFCSPGQINQVVLNIVVNAAQAIRSQGRGGLGNITITTSKTDHHVICQIIDDGPGIPQEIITKVFDPFFTTKPVGKGTGLGLSISRDIIVNKHKGELEVQSVVGTGTTFTIKLPLDPDVLRDMENQLQEQSETDLEAEIQKIM